MRRKPKWWGVWLGTKAILWCATANVKLTLLDHLNVVSQVDVGQVLDDDIEALVAGEVHQLLLVRLVVMVVNLFKKQENLIC